METSGQVLLFHRCYPLTLICVHLIYCFFSSSYISNHFDVSFTDKIAWSLTKKYSKTCPKHSKFQFYHMQSYQFGLVHLSLMVLVEVKH